MHLSRPITNRVKGALRYSTAEGVAYGAFTGFGEHYLVAYAVALQTNSLQIGMLCSLPGFIASLLQLFDCEIVRLMRGRKATILIFALLQGLIFLPILSLSILARSNQGWWMILFATLYSIFGALTSPAWGSLMAEVVPQGLRGKYFSRRGMFSTVASIFTFMAGGVFLNLLVQRSLWGFAVLFGAAVVCRLASWLLLTRLYEVPQTVSCEQSVNASQFSRGLLTTDLGKYMLFLFAMSFAVNIAGPYFTVYELRDLKFSYLTYAGLEAVSSVVTIFSVTHWGQAADRVGNSRIVRMTAALVPLVPLLWILSTNVAYLGLVQVFSGLAWAGYNLCTVNYLYDATTPENRTRYLAYFNAGNGISAGMGALTGGFLAPRIPALNGYPVLTLFLISGVLRGAVAAAFAPRIKEVRKVSNMPAAELFHMLLGGRPVNRRISHKQQAHVHYHKPSGVALESEDSLNAGQAHPKHAPQA
ncbi:MAG: MFS transporter [Chloroflexi bacterium]|nr:MFS transporter [Chloroflexota bacterium]